MRPQPLHGYTREWLEQQPAPIVQFAIVAVAAMVMLIVSAACIRWNLI